MKKLVCEQCGSVDLVKEDGYYVCQYCGCKYIPDDTGDQLVKYEEKPEPKRARVPGIVPAALFAAAVIALVIIMFNGKNDPPGGAETEAETVVSTTVFETEVAAETTAEAEGSTAKAAADTTAAETTTVAETFAQTDKIESEMQETKKQGVSEDKIQLPYVGMPEKDIDRTSLGRSYYNGANHDTINGKRTTVDIYFYIQSDYGIIYVARVANGKVIGVKDYRDDPWYFPAFIEGVKKNGRKTKSSY